jgi:hypothetical protein
VLAIMQFQLIPPRGIPVTRVTQSTGGSHPRETP